MNTHAFPNPIAIQFSENQRRRRQRRRRAPGRNEVAVRLPLPRGETEMDVIRDAQLRGGAFLGRTSRSLRFAFATRRDAESFRRVIRQFGVRSSLR